MDPEEARELAVAKTLDYEAIGFRCGLEIHQQLDTRKLFSPCPSGVVDPDEVARATIGKVQRRLRATQSELGETDAAALAEARRQKTFHYLAIDGLTSLVELDDEPPHPMSEDALDVALTFAGLLGSLPAAEVHVMRKTVIDGSNTSGFQRTALVATGGTVDVPSGDVGVWTIAVEEDSARKVDDEEGRVTYTLDRLGVPLIEIATAPDVRDPRHAQETAARIGALLRATGRVRRGLGTIRQDLNVSVGVGDRVEIKGCQDLRAVPRVIENECRRQLWLHHVAGTLESRGFTPQDLPAPQDVTSAFQGTDAKIVASALARKQGVWGLRLPGWQGLIAGASKDGPRLGREFADHAKVAAGVRGVFHSDELPAYGISEAEVQATAQALGCEKQDGFVLCVERRDIAVRALEAVADRAAAALAPQREVRAAQPDDSTRFMRPMPGAARMYPETDVPPTRIPAERWQQVLASLPLRPEEKVARLQETHKINAETAGQLVREGVEEQFEAWLSAGAEPGLAARILLQLLPALAHPSRVAAAVPDILARLRQGAFAKEAVPDILAAMDAAPDRDVDAAIDAAGAQAADASEVEDIVARVVGERIDFVRERGMAAMGPLMGPVMAELRGKADGKAVADALKKELGKLLA